MPYFRLDIRWWWCYMLSFITLIIFFFIFFSWLLRRFLKVIIIDAWLLRFSFDYYFISIDIYDIILPPWLRRWYFLHYFSCFAADNILLMMPIISLMQTYYAIDMPLMLPCFRHFIYYFDMRLLIISYFHRQLFSLCCSLRHVSMLILIFFDAWWLRSIRWCAIRRFSIIMFPSMILPAAIYFIYFHYFRWLSLPSFRCYADDVSSFRCWCFLHFRRHYSSSFFFFFSWLFLSSYDLSIRHFFFAYPLRRYFHFHFHFVALLFLRLFRHHFVISFFRFVYYFMMTLSIRRHYYYHAFSYAAIPEGIE